ncbi:MAG: signal peptidase I [Bacilli bacterium]|nr:signal peptidase I [Bacilli bacterium]
MHSKLLKKICNIILDILIVIFGLILIITIYNDVQVKAFNKDYADFFGYTSFEVQTGSMVPAININDLVIVKIDNSPKINDIITYKKGNSFITHRVVESYKETYVTRGDANNTKDDAITKSQIVGKVIKVIPNFGTIRKTLLNPLVLVTLIVCIFILSRLFSNKKTSIKDTISKKKKPKLKEEIELMEEELDKPIAVNITEIEEEKEDEEIEDEEIEELKRAISEENINVEDEDEEKTIYFRKISVDSSDLNPELPVLIEEEPEEPILIEEVNEKDEEIKIETLRRKHKKFNTVIEKAVFIKEEEINEIINVLDDEKQKTNEATIKDSFLKIYIDGKYYNHCGDVVIDYNSKNVCSKLEKILSDEAIKMIKNYKGNDVKYEYKVLKYKTLLILITNIEQINLTIEDIDSKATQYKKKISKYLDIETKELNEKIKEIFRIQKVYKKIMSDTLESVDTNTFELHYNQLSTNKNIYGLVLEHNISFSKVYSNYIISKTYDEGVVAEDKILVILNIVLSKIASDMMNSNFKNKYLLYLPASLYEKDNKLNHILKILEDEFVKNSVLILIKSSVILKNKKIIKDIKKLGYQIAIVYDNVSPKDKNDSIFALATYLFIDKKLKKEVSFDVVDSKTIIYENILDKVDIPGGDE